MHEFEVFRRASDVSRAQPHVTIQRRGLISLNSAAFRALGAPAAVELLYNADERIMGMRPVDARAPHRSLVRPSTRSGNPPYLISGSVFTRHYEIDTSTTVRRKAYLRDDMLCVDLDTAALSGAGAEYAADDESAVVADEPNTSERRM